MNNSSKWTREYYLSQLESYSSRYPTRANCEPKPPYKSEEVPQWWPLFLRIYLTEVSRESYYGHTPCIVPLPIDPTLTLEQTKQKIQEEALKNIEEDGGPEKSFEWELKHEKLPIEEIIQLYLENEELDGLSVMVGDGGCSFSDQCDLRTGKIYYHDGNSYDCGIVLYNKMYVQY